MINSKMIQGIFIALISLLTLGISMAQAATVSQVPAQLPLFVNSAVPPMNMLVVGRDHKLFFPAYNDASDLDGSGSIDIHYKPSITYLGYFDSFKCYSYTGSYFTAKSTTADKTCGGSYWSGDYLNYLTTSRADALRKVLYGGYRYVDTATQTILSRAYISTDAHTWGKEYTSLLIDGYNLSDYTPLANPTGGNRALFANNSQGTTEATYPPLLRVIPSIANARIFGWVSRDGTEGGTTVTSNTFQSIIVTPTDYAVRVEVCKTGFLESNCKLYPNGQYKPTGILHDYGEGNQMYFGLMTGTYSNNIQGGAVRKAIGSFSNEIDASTGIFGTKTGSVYVKGGIIGTLDGLKLYPSTCSDSAMSNGNCLNWGNPLAEMMFETMRYFSGTTTPTTNYLSGTADTTLGLSGLTAWTNPYSSTPNAAATNPTYPYCTKPFETLFSDINPNYDSDLPGSSFTSTNPPSATTALTNLNVTTLGGTIWNAEVGGTTKINIGESIGTANDLAPTAKSASSFGTIRGLQEEPTKQGTYDAAAVAYYGNTNVITTLGSQKVQTFSIALSSTLPRIQMPVGTGTITLLPFGKVTNTGNTEQLTGFYIDSLYNMTGQPTDTGVNGGRAQAIFRVVYDDCNQGCDYDMDAIGLYTVAVNANNTLTVTVQTVYSVAGNESHMGYTISGTTADGIYLEVTGGGNGNVHYALDTPGTQLPNSCAIILCTGASTLLPGLKNNNGTVSLGDTHVRTFTPSGTTSVANLQNPLWYAAKWGGFGDTNNKSTSVPVTGQWDSNVSGTPNNYFLVTNASTLKAQLANAFNQILQTNSSVSGPAVTQTGSANSSNSVYQGSLNVNYWSGDVVKTTTTSTTTGTTTTTSAAINWTASQQMPAWGSRQIMMANAAGTALQPFTYSALASVSYAGVQLQSTLTSSQVDFVKGDTSNETSTFRKRATLIGDIVNSGPLVVSAASYLPSVADTLDGTVGTYATFQTTQTTRRAQVYIGANDGMLHAFDAATGIEKFAFIPTAVISNLNALTAKTYNSDSSLHKYFVDNTPVSADVYFNSAWHTVLIGTLGGGGREIFALDITDPDNIKLLWEFTSQTDSDLGYTFSTPVISKLHNGNWGVIVGNGYSGNNGNASLLILNAATGATISKLATSVSGNNGLSSPVVLDANSDGIADYVYAGDLQGNLWRFDLIGAGSLTATATTSNFKVAFGNTPLYSATASASASAAVQSITAVPTFVQHPSGTGVIVIFGTGRYFTSADKSTTDVQTMYGIWDKQTAAETAPTTPTLGRASLQVQTILSQASATFGTKTQVARIVSATGVDWTSKYGWLLDLSFNGSLLGERLIDPMSVVGSVLFATTRTPISDVCSPGVTGFTYGLDPTTGGSTTFTVFNLSQNGTISTADNLDGSVVSAFGTVAGGFAVTSYSDPNNTSANGTLINAGTSISTNTGALSEGRQTWRGIPLSVPTN